MTTTTADAKRIYRFSGLDARIPDSAFARNADGSVTVTGIDLLKSGTFNGLGLVDADLDAMVAHFEQLRDSGTFLPPFRLDHSWSVLAVIGWFDELETYGRVDETDGVAKTFLKGDVRITGSVDYTPAQIVAAIKAGSLRNRSSELGYYVTNAGVELPLVFYGAAFVDIPAVEGLAPVSLSAVRHEIVNLTEGSGMTEQNPEQTTDEPVEGTQEQPAETPADPPAETEEVVEEPPAANDNPDEPRREQEDQPVTDPVPTPATPAANPEVEQLRQEVTRLRTEAATRQVTEFRTRGVVNAENEEAATALLTHESEDVRRMAGTLLSSVPSLVTLGKRTGRTTLSHDGTGATGTVIELGMSKDEAMALWASLSTEDRKARQSELDAWQKHRDETGDRT